MSTKPVTTVAERFAAALTADGYGPNTLRRKGIFGNAIMDFLDEFAVAEAQLFALEDQSEDEKQRLQQHEQWTPKVEALTHWLSANADGLNLGRNALDVALEMLTAARADKVYSANTIYHIGTDENGKVIATGTRSTSDAHKDFHVMHAALELSQAYELRGVEFDEHKVGGLMVRPAIPAPPVAASATVEPIKPEVTPLLLDEKAVYKLLVALTGGAHEIRELQATRGLKGGNPIDVLAQQYNDWVNAGNQP